jgi:hypothetical protein
MRFLLPPSITPMLLKAAHGAIGALGLAGLAYGAKKAVDAARGGALGPAGYQLTPSHLINKAPYRTQQGVTPVDYGNNRLESMTLFPRSTESTANQPPPVSMTPVDYGINWPRNMMTFSRPTGSAAKPVNSGSF